MSILKTSPLTRVATRRLRERERLDELVKLNTPLMAKLLEDVEQLQGKPRAAWVVVLDDRGGRVEINAYARTALVRALRSKHVPPTLLAALERVPEHPTFQVVAITGDVPRVYRVNPEVI